MIVKTVISDHESRYLRIVINLALAIPVGVRVGIGGVLEGLARRIRIRDGIQVPLAIAKHKVDRVLLFDLEPFLGETCLYQIQEMLVNVLVVRIPDCFENNQSGSILAIFAQLDQKPVSFGAIAFDDATSNREQVVQSVKVKRTS